MRLPLWLLLAVAGSCCPAMAEEEDLPSLEGALEEAPRRIEKDAEGGLQLGGIRFDAESREIRVPCRILHQELPIEYLLVHENGKDHETVLTTAVSPLDLQVVMLLVHYQPGSIGLFEHLPAGEPVPFPEVAPEQPGRHRVMLDVEWSEDGAIRRSKLQQWYQNSDSRRPPEFDSWIFNGSAIDARGFVAETEGSFVSVYADRFALFNSPAAGNHRDDLWISLPVRIPPPDTPVTLIIRPAP